MMRPTFSDLMLLVWLLASGVFVPGASAEKGKKEPATQANRVAATLDVKNSKEGSIPGGASVKVGKWYVDAKASKLKINPRPLVEGWLEFGPEIREESVTVQGRMKLPGSGRLKSRGGVGLYGKNGFQLRLLPVSDQVELVRRGERIAVAEFPLETDAIYAIELAAIEGEDRWLLKGRVWKNSEERPEEPQIVIHFFLDELQFPLAGRAVLRATPFSGEPVLIAGAKAFYGEYKPVPKKPQKTSGEPKGDETDGGEEKKKAKSKSRSK